MRAVHLIDLWRDDFAWVVFSASAGLGAFLVDLKFLRLYFRINIILRENESQ